MENHEVFYCDKAGPDWNVLPGTDRNNHLLRDYLLRIAEAQYTAREKALNKAIGSPARLEQYSDKKRKAYLQLLGSLPEKTPLRAQVTGRLECQGYSIEKVLFETIPKHRATALLYIPEGDGPFPGVLFVCGHSANGKAFEEYQRVPAHFAREGMLVLAVDPIGQGERYQQFTMRGGTTTHTLYDVGARLVGRSVVFYEAWDNVRAIDYLLSRSEIDGEKPIGLTGTSGGGTQTTFLMALDQRVGPASPSCYVMTRQRKFETHGIADGCQHLWDEGLHRIDHADYAIMRLSKPTQVLAAEGDFFEIQATRRAAAEIRRAFEVAGSGDRFQLFVSNTGHGFTPPHRVAAVNWMRQWLLNKNDPVDDPDDLQVFPDERIQVTKSGQVGKDFDDEVNVGQLNRRRAGELEKQRELFLSKHDARTGLQAIADLLRLERPRAKSAVRHVAEFRHAAVVLKSW